MKPKDKDFYINNVKDLKAEDIANGIREGIVTFDELKKTCEFYNQPAVKNKLEEFKAEDDAYNAANTLHLLRDFLNNFPNSCYCEKVKEKIEQKNMEEKAKRKREFDEIKNNINDYKPDEILDKLGKDTLLELCEQLGIDYNLVANYDEPVLDFDKRKITEDFIPSNYTDVFFWGIPSSGKTCALSVILHTMKDKYTIDDPSIKTIFGVSYRNSLVNLFNKSKIKGIGYLPAATQKDRTQYMPFLVKKRGESNYRQVSFFELSGEVFKYFYELKHNSQILEDSERGMVESAFKTLDLLLNSKNQKIHFFFIDYKQETKGIRDKHNLTQENYLSAAATYFRDINDIFKRRTDAVYVVVTKADEIKANEEDKPAVARQFLIDNFGSFMDVIKSRCKEDRVHFGIKLFSIGDVYFKGICKINNLYARNIIDELLEKIKPVRETIISKILNS